MTQIDQPAGEVAKSFARLTEWLEDHQFRAFDPGDGQLSYLRHLTFGSLFLERILTAVILRTPFHVRPFLGIRPHSSTKGMGYIGWGFTKHYKLTRDPQFAVRAEKCFEWLKAHRSPNLPHFCWGNNFTFTTRAGRIPAYEPTIVWSSLIGLAFFEAYQVFEKEEYLQIAISVCEWILTLPRERTERGTCLSYVPSKQSSIHNSSMLGAGLLGCVSAVANREDFAALAREAMLYSCSRQNPDGAWYYGEAQKYHWIDNFHTGYNLDSLKRYAENTGNREFDLQLTEGFRYYRETFFEADGCPKYYHDKTLPIDIQCCAQSIDTLSTFSAEHPTALPLAQKVAQWTIRNMQDPDGHFYYRDIGWKKIKTPMLHWGQGTMLKALANLANQIANAASVAAASSKA